MKIVWRMYKENVPVDPTKDNRVIEFTDEKAAKQYARYLTTATGYRFLARACILVENGDLENLRNNCEGAESWSESLRELDEKVREVT